MAFVVVGLFLSVVGLGDLFRAASDAASRRRRLVIMVLGAALLGLAVALLEGGALARILLWLALTGAHAAWVEGSARALGVTGRAADRARVLAAVGLAAGLVVGLLGAEVGSAPDWPRWLDDTGAARWPVSGVVVAAGALLVQLATANIVVRLLLDQVGVPATANEKQLKGGRVLGPMERIFIVGLGAIGEVTAAAIVVAAKGLLRFPELQRAVRVTAGERVIVEHGPGAGADAADDVPGPTDVTEYFLIGSFASWLVALAGVALIYLA